MLGPLPPDESSDSPTLESSTARTPDIDATEPMDDVTHSPSLDRVTIAQPPPRASSFAMELSSSNLVDETAPSVEPPTERSYVGKILSGRYRIGPLLGKGGMGAVYAGEQIHLRKRVAIKLLRPDAERLPELVARFEREAVAGAHVDHPNVAAAIDFGRLEDRSYFLALEYVEGAPLKDAMANGPMPPVRALRIARQLASALVAVHAKGIVHRDIKPQNILLSKDDHVKLIDFGLSKVRVELLSPEVGAVTKPEVVLTTAGVVFGTVAYMAPEVSLGMDAVDARADLYAFGIILYELLSGRRPFDATEAVSLFRHQRLEDPPPLAVRSPELAILPEIDALVMRLIQRKPEDRYATAAEALAAIDGAIAMLERPAPSASTPVPVWAVVVGMLGVAAPLALVLSLAFGARGSAGASASAAATEEDPSRTSSLSDANTRSGNANATASAAADPALPPATLDGLDADAWKARLRKASATKNWVAGAKAFLALTEIAPAVLGDRALRADVVAVAAGIGFEKSSNAADDVFDALEKKLGHNGLDILYDVIRTRGGTKASRRANEIFSTPEVLERATPALRIALELRRSDCSGKRRLLERAANEGDERTLFQLTVLRGARCRDKKDPCCFDDDPKMADAIAKLKERLGG